MTKHTASTPVSLPPQPVSSMTGFARKSLDLGDLGSGTLSIKTVNHRFLDLQFRMPSGLDALEMELRRVLKENLVRGHVDFTLTIERTSNTLATINRELVASYIEAFRTTTDTFHLAGEPDPNVLLRLPGVLQTDSRASVVDEDQLASRVLAALPELLDSLKAMRQREGAALTAILLAVLDALSVAVDEIALLRPEIEARFQTRIETRLQEHLTAALSTTEIASQRILEEVAMLVERSDVSEEIARMRTHIQHFADVLQQGGETGKKLDFLLQEMNREANTLLSKTTGIAGKGTRITELGLQMKAEIEKAREQIQNLE